MSLFGLPWDKGAADSLEQLKTIVQANEVTLMTIQRDCKALQLEWESTYDKLYHLAQRLNKRNRDQLKAEVAAEPTIGETPTLSPGSDFRTRVLSRRRHA